MCLDKNKKNDFIISEANKLLFNRYEFAKPAGSFVEIKLRCGFPTVFEDHFFINLFS